MSCACSRNHYNVASAYYYKKAAATWGRPLTPQEHARCVRTAQLTQAGVKGIREGEIGETFTWIARRTHVDIVDKEVDASMVCPQIVRRIAAGHLMGAGAYERVSGWRGLAIHNAHRFFWDVDGEGGVRTSLKRRNGGHRWGYLRILIKAKTFTEAFSQNPEQRGAELLKYRPITSYRGHIWLEHYRLAGRIAMDILRRDRRTGVLFFEQIQTVTEFIRKINRFARRTQLEIECRTGDIGDFFTNCDTERGIRAVEGVIDAHIRRTGATIASTKKTSGDVILLHRRSGDPLALQKGRALKAKMNQISYRRTRPDERFWNWMDIRDVAKTLRHDARYTFVRALQGVWQQVRGSPMGSPTATPISNGFAIDVELQMGKRTNATGARWVDDKIVFFVRHTATDLLDENFYPGCRLKEEGGQGDLTFVGMTLSKTGGRWKGEVMDGGPIAHGLSAGLKIRGVVKGHMCRVRQFSTDPSPCMFNKIVEKLVAHGYPRRIVVEEWKKQLLDL